MTRAEDTVMHALKQPCVVGALGQRSMVGAWLLLIMCLVLTIWVWRVAKMPGCVRLLQQRYQGQLDTHANVLIAHVMGLTFFFPIPDRR